MSPKHTPGPWTLNAGKVRNRSRSIVADVRDTEHDNPPTREAAEANAHLIAAAPELLEALRDMATIIKTPGTVTDVEAEDLGVRYDMENGPWSAICQAVIDRARAAIAKAEGRHD